MDCTSLNSLANGQVNHTSGTTFGQNAIYSCNTGYNLVGNSTRTCQDTGEWSGSAPTCQGMLLKGDMALFYVHVHKKHNNMCLGLAYSTWMQGYDSAGWTQGRIPLRVIKAWDLIFM